MSRVSLAGIHRDSLAELEPSRLVARWIEGSGTEFEAIIAIGKCAGPMIDGASGGRVSSAAAKLSTRPRRVRCFAAIPRNYPHPTSEQCELHEGGHPEPDATSLRAGEALLRFVDDLKGPALVLLSGGGSATIDIVDEEVIDPRRWLELQRVILRSGVPIEQMNLARAAVSRLKGGGLASLLPDGSVTLIISDVDPLHPEAVASGPTFPRPDCDAMRRALASFGFDGSPRPHPNRRRMENAVLADNATLVETAARIGMSSFARLVIERSQLNGDVVETAEWLADRIPPRGSLLVAGGEPTVKVRGGGVGGRGSELALRVVQLLQRRRVDGVRIFIGTSDGVDGSAPAGAYLIDSADAGKIESDEIAQALETSNSYPLVARCVETIIMRPTGNNLRDLFLVARA